MLDSTPTANQLWEGIGGHFENLGEVLCEFIDNSISNLINSQSSNRTIYISVESEKEKYRISIEDGGGGIASFEPIMRLGDKSVKQSPLNEHGFGLKHALATANPSNDDWRIFTRTEDDTKKNQFREIKASYDFKYIEHFHDASQEKWPGRTLGTGTFIEFSISQKMFDTLQHGISGTAGFIRCLEYLAEDLGYIYSGMLAESAVNIIIDSSILEKKIIVKPIVPDWVDYYQNPKPNKIEKDLGGGKIEIDYKFGEMRVGESARYYKKNMSSSGIEIRVNGRLLMDNLFKEIWLLENHPTYNHFLGQINLISNDSSRLPKTKTSKNSIRREDEKLHVLFEWIRKFYPNPEKKLTNAISERELIRELAETKDKHTRSSEKRIETDFTVYKNLGSQVLVDLYFYDGNEVVIYEAKKNTADVKDFYQLLMYWDGLVSDGTSPNEGILLASEFSEGVKIIINDFNKNKTDSQGNKYNFVLKTWEEEGIKLE